MRSGTNGTIQSPLNPLSHNIDTKCRWTITVPSGHRIKLNFSAFDLGEIAGQDTCDGVDYVDVRDSYNDNDPPYGKFCGNKKPSTIYSVGPRIVVTFVSDGKKRLRGFSAKFEAISGGRLNLDISLRIAFYLTHWLNEGGQNLKLICA